VTSRGHEDIDLQEVDCVYLGAGTIGRQWRITRAVAGWRLDFTDPGDTTPTNAGLHGSVAAARTEASTRRSTSKRS
jgi:hypothetical protein